MIKKVIQISDIHVPNYQRHDEYNEVLNNLVHACQEECNGYDSSEVRIVLCGDVVHQKNTVSNELNMLTSSFIRSLESLCKVIVIMGNHDLLLNNSSRADTLTALFETAKFGNSILLDMELGYQSGVYEDDNIKWALYSICDGYSNPFPKGFRKTKSAKVIGLFHGQLVGATNFNGMVYEDGTSIDEFDKCDAVMAGHIHKRQVIPMPNGNDFVYSGSLVQRDEGESVLEHGYAVWNIDTIEHKFVDIASSYGIYKIEVNDLEDLDNDLEIIDNLI